MSLLLLPSQLLLLPLPVNPTASFVTPVTVNTALDLTTLTATDIGADVTIVGNTIVPNNLLLRLLL